MPDYDWDTHPKTWSPEQREAVLSVLDGEQPMNEDVFPYKTWSHQFQGKSYGDAVDKAVEHWKRNVSPNSRINPDEITVVGPFSIFMRREAINKYDNTDDVWDITIKWYVY